MTITNGDGHHSTEVVAAFDAVLLQIRADKHGRIIVQIEVPAVGADEAWKLISVPEKVMRFIVAAPQNLVLTLEQTRAARTAHRASMADDILEVFGANLGDGLGGVGSNSYRGGVRISNDMTRDVELAVEPNWPSD